MASERQNRLDVVQFGRMLHGNGFVAATDGNLSVRLDERRLLVTPTCISKGRMRASDMVIVDMDGKRLSGASNIRLEEALLKSEQLSGDQSEGHLPGVRCGRGGPA